MHHLIPVRQMKREEYVQNDAVIELEAVLAEVSAIQRDYYLVDIK
jgi:hypothetical protein